MSKTIFTFFESLPEHNMVAERILVSLWVQKWKERGFEPIVLNEFHAKQSPGYAEFERAVSKLPSINPAGYDRACYIRWLAVAVAAKEMKLKQPVLMCDHDVFPYPGIEKVELFSDKLTCYQGTCPALVSGSISDFLKQGAYFADYKVTDDNYDGKPHTSDMYLLEKRVLKSPDAVRCLKIVKDFGEDGWEQAPLVHYANRCCTPNYQPRWKHIPSLRA